MRKNEDKAKKYSRWMNKNGTEWEVTSELQDGYIVLAPINVETGQPGPGNMRTLKTDSLAANYRFLREGAPSTTAEAAAKPAQDKSVEYKALEAALYNAAAGGSECKAIVTVPWTITPALAQDLLLNSPSQRATSNTRVERLARDITNKNWRLSHQGIALGPKFELGDGQHRCLAVLRTGAHIATQVTWYTDDVTYEEARATWDTQWTRTAGSTMELIGEVARGEGRFVVALLRSVIHVDSRWPRNATNEDLKDMYEELKPHVTFALTLPKDMAAPVKAAFMIAHMKAPEAVEELGRLVVRKVGYADKSAAHSLVLKLPALQAKNQGRERPGVTKDVLSLIYKHVKKQPGVDVLKTNPAALAFFLGGDNVRENSSGR